MILSGQLIETKNLYQLQQKDWKSKKAFYQIIFNTKKDIFLRNRIRNMIYKKLLKMIKRNLRFIKLIYLNFIILKKF
jgi:hypothetical protein